MNRSITNLIRWWMDECLPPIIRDNKFFMAPFYWLAYRGRNVDQAMNFKRLVYGWSRDQYADFYNDLNTISRNRPTDLNQACIERILEEIQTETSSIADIGCGNGYMLYLINRAFPSFKLFGVDIKPPPDTKYFEFVQANIEKLPFEDSSIDVVMCNHTLEHCLNPTQVIDELKRVAKSKVIVTVPCQRYYFYTLDEHVNFYPFKEKLAYKVGLKNPRIEKLRGDWFLVAQLSK